MKTKKLIIAVIQGVIGTFLFLIVGLFVAYHFFKIELVRPYLVQSGSMEPVIKVGSVVFSIPQKTYQTGDIITFAPNDNTDNLVTHRVEFKLYPTGVKGDPIFLTSGDANEDIDRWEITEEQIVGKVLLSIPYLGYAVNFAKKPYGFILLVMVPSTIIIYEELKSIKGQLSLLFNKLRHRVRSKKKSSVINLLPSKKEKEIPKAAIMVPVIGAIFVLISVSASYFFDIEKSLNNILGASGSFGEKTAAIYESIPYTCPSGASITDDEFGFVVIDIENNTVSVDVSLSGAKPDSSYDIWVNQDPGGCPLSSPTAPGALTTNADGDDIAHVDTPLVETATNFWISAVGGDQVLRSVAVSFD